MSIVTPKTSNALIKINEIIFNVKDITLYFDREVLVVNPKIVSKHQAMNIDNISYIVIGILSSNWPKLDPGGTLEKAEFQQIGTVHLNILSPLMKTRTKQC